MASVPLDFVPPSGDDITALRIYESLTADGPWTLIETVADVGVYPDYISDYMTNNAVSATDWFAIQWMAGTTAGPISEPIQGGTTTAVGEITRRVMSRMPGSNERIVFEEAQTVVEEYMGDVNIDASAVSYRKISGMTLLVMAGTMLVTAASGASDTESFTAGLVSMKSSSDSSSGGGDPELLMKLGAKMLGISTSRVVQMIVPPIAAGYSEIVTADISRLLIEVE